MEPDWHGGRPHSSVRLPALIVGAAGGRGDPTRVAGSERPAHNEQQRGAATRGLRGWRTSTTVLEYQNGCRSTVANAQKLQTTKMESSMHRLHAHEVSAITSLT